MKKQILLYLEGTIIGTIFYIHLLFQIMIVVWNDVLHSCMIHIPTITFLIAILVDTLTEIIGL